MLGGVKRVLWLVALLAGCDHVWGLERGSPKDANECFGRSSGKGLIQLCTDKILDDEYILPQDVDTDDVPPVCSEIVIQQDADRTEICVIAADRIRVQGAPSMHGGRPLVLLARHTVIVDPDTVIDVATHRSGKDGAGAPNAKCVGSNGSNGTTGGGGGAGGGFNGPGQRGANATGGTGGGGGPPTAAIALAAVRAGCPGGKGGTGFTSGGGGGTGGGALYMIAGDRIEVSGTINASGEGGGAGMKPTPTGGGGGGGGGGSGGLIGFDAPTVAITTGTVLVANGGGAGGGGAVPGGAAGSDGSDPAVFGGVFPFKASGGVGGVPMGGTGGDGAAGAMGPTIGQDSTGGAGGGGGAAGYIRIFGGQIDDSNAVFSPPPGP